MRTRPVLVILLSSLGLFACGGAANEEAKSAANPWADFKGTYSAPASPEQKSEKAEAAKKEAHAKAEPKEETSEAPTPAPVAKKTSKGTVQGESLSSISVDSLTDASKTALKAKFVSNSVVTGPQYELVQVQLKGATVQIIRPAEKPSPNGPAIASPKAKNGELSKTDAGWYDEEADVLVLVNAPKKAAAQKALGTIVKH
jgi:hypothetical protein